MTEDRQIPMDDIMDVHELSQKLELGIKEAFVDVERELALSALMSAFINSILDQCKTMEDALFYRSLFIRALDNTIASIQVEN